MSGPLFTEQINVMAPPGLQAAIREAARSEGQTASESIHQAIRVHVAEARDLDVRVLRDLGAVLGPDAAHHADRQHVHLAVRGHPVKDSTFRPSQSEFLGDGQKEIIQGALDAMIDPSLVGDMVLHAIAEDVFYIFTHPEFKQGFSEKTVFMQQIADYWQRFIDDH